MASTASRGRFGLRAPLVALVSAAAALWTLSIWSTVWVSSSHMHMSLHRGMVRVSLGQRAVYERQFGPAGFGYSATPFEFPASFGLHWPYWDGPLPDVEMGLSLAALWVPGAFIIGVCACRRRRRGFCRCGYDLTGNVSGRCPECGRAARPAREVGR